MVVRIDLRREESDGLDHERLGRVAVDEVGQHDDGGRLDRAADVHCAHALGEERELG